MTFYLQGERMANDNNSMIKKNKIRYVPPEVNFSHVHLQTFKLLSAEQIAHLKKKFTKDGIYSKQETECGYGLIVQDKRYFLIYFGASHEGMGVASGAQGTSVKYVLDLDADWQDNDWYVDKVQNPKNKNEHIGKKEKILIEKLGVAVTTFGGVQRSVTVKKFSKTKNEKRLHLLMKLAKGFDLFYVESKQVELSLIMLLELFRKILMELDKLHYNRVIHADIKPENIRLDPGVMKVELVDFGHALALPEDGKSSVVVTAPFHGTHGFFAPEVVSNLDKETSLTNYTCKVDIYSAGVLFILLSRLGELRGQWREKLYCYHADESEYTHHPFFTKDHHELKASLFDHFLEMISDEEHRPSIQRSIEFIIEKQRALQAEDRTMQVGVLDAQQYATLKNNLSKQELLSELMKFDRVYIVDADGNDNPFLYAKIHWELAKAKVKVMPEVVHGPSLKTISEQLALEKYDVELPHILTACTLVHLPEQHIASTHHIYHSLQSNNNNNVVNPTLAPVMPTTEQIILEMFKIKFRLQGEIQKLEDKYARRNSLANIRMNDMQAIIDKIDTIKPEFDVRQTPIRREIHRLLVRLESELVSTKSFSCLLGKTGLFSPKIKLRPALQHFIQNLNNQEALLENEGGKMMRKPS